MSSAAPPWLDQTSDFSDTELYARMSPSERLDCFVDVCELSRTILQGRSDTREVLDRREPMAPDVEKTWRALVARARHARTSR